MKSAENPNEETGGCDNGVTSDDWNALVNNRNQAYASYDKAALSVAGGAFGVSMIFVSDVIRTGEPVAGWALTSAWLLFTISVATLLASFITSQMAHEKALQQVRNNEISEANFGGKAAKITSFLNWLGFATIIVGLLFLLLFAVKNI